MRKNDLKPHRLYLKLKVYVFSKYEKFTKFVFFKLFIFKKIKKMIIL